MCSSICFIAMKLIVDWAGLQSIFLFPRAIFKHCETVEHPLPSWGHSRWNLLHLYCSATHSELFVQELQKKKKKRDAHMGMDKQAGVHVCHIFAFLVISRSQKWLLAFCPLW